MPKPRRVHRATIDIFNRELDRAVHGWTASETDLTSDEVRALSLAQKLAASDFSGGSAIQPALRNRLAQRSTHSKGRMIIRNHLTLFREGHALGGLGMAALLVLVLAFGLLSPQHVSATPVLNTLDASASLLVQPAIPHTRMASHNQGFYPKPVPTPVAMPVLVENSTSSLEGTPARAAPSLGEQFPIITTTISK